MSLVLRHAVPSDREQLEIVEAGATPGLRYLPLVFDDFVADATGAFLVAEVEGQVVACGKFTVLPDGSAWLETLRVLPEMQGTGIGKRFYERFFELAQAKRIPVMRMYTTIGNLASKGLAERHGFTLAGICRGWKRACPSEGHAGRCEFQPVTDPRRGEELLLSFGDALAGFLVMNRTFYAVTPSLAAYLVRERMIFEEPASGSVIALGARFAPQTALHIGLMGGDLSACLSFAGNRCMETGASDLCALFPLPAKELHAALENAGYQAEPSPFIVMEAAAGGPGYL